MHNDPNLTERPGAHDGNENLTSNRDGSLPLDFQLHFNYWSDLGDGGRRYRSTAREKLFPAPVANGRKSSDDDLREPNEKTSEGKQDP